jgi:hypothetical protein
MKRDNSSRKITYCCRPIDNAAPSSRTGPFPEPVWLALDGATKGELQPTTRQILEPGLQNV